MATPVIMPRQGQSVESCIITKFHKNKGDQVAVGDKLFSYETDKASFEEESTVAGELLEIFWEEGDDVECLLNVLVIGEHGEDTAAFNPKGAAPAEEAPKAEAAPIKEEVAVQETKAVALEVPAEGKVKISPRAKALAEKQGLDYKYAVATGPNGRVIERDIRAMAVDGVKFTAAAAADYAANGAVEGTGLGGRIGLADYAAKPEVAAAPAAAPVETPFVEEKIPNIRKVIAKSMHASLSEMAQLTLNTSFDATQILAYRARLKACKDDMGFENITLNDIVMYAVAKTLPEFRALNAHWLDDKMVYFNNVNLGIAVDTPRGLLVPTVFGADKMTLNELSKQAKTVISAAQNGTVSPDLLRGASFTVTNLGAMGIESFTPVINPPQTGILGICTTETKIRVVNGEIKPYQAMGLSLTFDHRALDGAPAAKFLQALRKNLENFDLLLAR